MDDKIQCYVQADLRNENVLKYLSKLYESFEPVTDILTIKVIQCITPEDFGDLDLPTLSTKKGRSPQEEASLYSQYRLMKRIAKGERLFIMEHDAYLRPEHEDTFRMIMSKYEHLFVVNIGIAMEFYTCHPRIAKEFVKVVDNDVEPVYNGYRGPMDILHRVSDRVCKRNEHRNVYWPKRGQKNETGLNVDVSKAFNNPRKTLPAPITQMMDEKLGSTVTDRRNIKPKYTRESHPNFHWLTLD